MEQGKPIFVVVDIGTETVWTIGAYDDYYTALGHAYEWALDLVEDGSGLKYTIENLSDVGGDGVFIPVKCEDYSFNRNIFILGFEQ